MQTINKTHKWYNQLFSENLLKNKNSRELVNIFFARSNIFLREGKYRESAENLLSATLKETLKNLKITQCPFL